MWRPHNHGSKYIPRYHVVHHRGRHMPRHGQTRRRPVLALHPCVAIHVFHGLVSDHSLGVLAEVGGLVEVSYWYRGEYQFL